MTSPPVMRVEDLGKVYGKKHALSGVTFEVRPGDLFGFLGPNGAGKTTTIRIALGLIRASAGRVFLFGRRRRGAALAEMGRIGAMVEVPSFYPHLSGRENLRTLAVLSGTPRSEVERVLGIVRMTGAAGDPVRTYSQGMRQRLGIAQALLGNPEFLVLDEPTNGLDPHGVQEIRELLVRLNREEGLTLLVSSHQLDEIEAVCNRVAILRQGRLLITGDVDGIVTEDRVTYRLAVTDRPAAIAALGDDFPVREGADGLRVKVTGDAVTGVVERLVRAGVGVREVVPERLSLLDYFLRVTEGEEVDLGR
jgi:ABC-2 type transport system ATP-binding protein